MNFSLKGKEPYPNSVRVRSFILFIFAFNFSYIAIAQVEQRVKTPPDILPMKADTSGIKKDTLILAQDTLKRPSDSTIVQQPTGDVETTINYSARDSIRASVDGKLIWLYGEAKIVYGEIELEADEIVIDYKNSTLTAHGTRDSLGQRVGYPVFKNGQELYETKDIV